MAPALKSKIGIIGGGPAGCMSAYYLQNDFDVTVFDFGTPLRTLLPTGGGRCNLAHAEYDFKELAKNYPRGEKFLYSVFSKFATYDTLEFFEKIGIKTYTQDNLRIFPVSNSAKDVREKFLYSLKKTKFRKEKVSLANKLEHGFSLITENGSYYFDKIIIASGGHASYEIAAKFGHSIIEPKPALVGLKTKEDLSNLAGIALNDILFTHTGISGPKIYEISSLKARELFPYSLSFDFIGEIDLQQILNSNPHKSIKNIIGELVPHKLAEFVLNKIKVNPDTKAHRIDGKTRDAILFSLNNFTVTVVDTVKDGEVVTCGGVSLDEINPKTMESKIIQGLYFAGEVINADGFCGGFNLQNCWSTGYVAAKGIISTL